MERDIKILTQGQFRERWTAYKPNPFNELAYVNNVKHKDKRRPVKGKDYIITRRGYIKRIG